MTTNNGATVNAPATPYVDVSDDEDTGLVPAGYQPAPDLNNVAVADVFTCLAKGVRDFKATWPLGLLFASIYVIGGIGMVALAFTTGNQQAVFPLIAGFLLIGPITAVGLYDISRRLEAGLPIDKRAIMLSFTRHGGTQLMLFGAALVFVMLTWFLAARLIYALAFGMHPLSIWQIADHALSSPDVALFLVAGNLVGAWLAGVVFAMSVIAVPRLLDRDTDFMSAMTLSISAVRKNPVAMLTFAVIIGCGMAISVLTAFIGLFVVMPVIGHATWHLYRMVVEETGS